MWCGEMFRKVLFPTDFSKQSEAILRGLHEFKKYGVDEVVLANIIEHDVVALIEGGVDVDEFIQKLKKEAEKKLSQSASVLNREGFKVKLTPPIPSANPIDEIVKIAREENVSLILLGSRSRGFKGSLMGSVSEGVVREAKKPVLVLKTKPDAGEGYYEMVFRRLFDRIIYPHDLSDTSQKIEDFVKKASLLGGKEVIIVHVIAADEIIEREVEREEVMHPLVPISNLTEMLSKHWMEAQTYLSNIKKNFDIAGIKTRVNLRVGSPHKEIIKIANEEGASVVMISSKGLTPNVDFVVRYSEQPVIVFH